MSRSILSEEEQSQQSNNNNNGLFGLTEIKIKEKQQEKQQQQVSSDIPHVSLQNKLISMVLYSFYLFISLNFSLFLLISLVKFITIHN